MAPRHDVQSPPDPVREGSAFVVHRIGPETYSVSLKRHAVDAKVIWRD
jgi:hypothetical protein